MSRRSPAGARTWSRRARVAAILGATAAATWMSAYALVAYAPWPPGSATPPLAGAHREREAVMYVHVLGASLAPVVGLVQLSSRVRHQWPRTHAWLGRLYLGVCVFLGGVAGLWLALCAVSGLATRLGFGLLGLAWLTTGAVALARICDGDVAGHRAWMYRNYALTWGAVMVRAYMGVAQEVLGLSFDQAYPVVAWLAWVPNLVVAERMVARHGAPRRRAGRP